MKRILLIGALLVTCTGCPTEEQKKAERQRELDLAQNNSSKFKYFEELSESLVLSKIT